ncbi:MAG TPA: DUF2269 family protein [Candidatus Eisenbacteria bacterium]|nr:DUF2269 family protein [Candidatus Eisenbacteria bacterium]
MPGLFFVFLALHLIAVVVAYGSTIALPFVRTASPAASSQLLALERVVTEKLALPAALSMPFSGAAMVIVAGINPTTQFWLWASIVLYLGTLVYLVIRQWPGVVRLVRGSGSAEELKRLRQSSIGLLVVILVIGAMMMFKPGHT